MNDYKIAAYIVPGALRAANAAEENPLDTATLIELSGVLSSAVSTYGCRQQKVILKAALKVNPDFKMIAENFFLALKETPAIAEVVHTKEYQHVSEFIIENKNMTARQRMKLYNEQYASSGVKFWKGFRTACLFLTVLCTLLTIGICLSKPEYREQLLQTWKKLKESAGKIKNHAKIFCKTVKFLIHQLTK